MADSPDKTTLSDADQKLIVDALTPKWAGSHECPICKAIHWTLVPYVSTPMELAGLKGGIRIGGGKVQPTATIVCMNCGYTMNFNLVAMGVVPPDSEPTPSGGGNVTT